MYMKVNKILDLYKDIKIPHHIMWNFIFINLYIVCNQVEFNHLIKLSKIYDLDIFYLKIDYIDFDGFSKYNYY